MTEADPGTQELVPKHLFQGSQNLSERLLKMLFLFASSFPSHMKQGVCF